MSPSRVEKVSGKYHTFFTKRFDRLHKERIHFASAMTMTGNNEDTLKQNPASYLDIAEFLQFNGAQNKSDLHQLWRRLVFNIAISNTDDHLRNHGFLLTEKGWILSPAFDLNPSIDKGGLALNIDSTNNALDIELAKSVGQYFQLTLSEMNVIIGEVNAAVRVWRHVAQDLNISRADQELMASAFRII
jgi:serine/threonine-protein kinase HipA